MTRFLIKHLPQQLARLRNEKAEQEDKIRELESLVSQQRYSLAEQERRADKEKSRANRLEERMLEVSRGYFKMLNCILKREGRYELYPPNHEFLDAK